MKKKIISVCLVVCLLAICVSGTLAYLTDNQAQKNTFTVGKVDISLDEAKVVKNETTGNLDADGDKRTSDTQNYHLFPAMTVVKDPTIHVASDSENAYIGAKVVIKGDIHGLIGVEGNDNIDITKLASGGLFSSTAAIVNDWNGLSMVHETDVCVIYQDASNAANKEWTLYIFIKAVQAKDADITLFDTLTIPAAWDHAQMEKLHNMTIEVTAFATQANGLADVFTALTTAFPSHFNFS